MESKSEPMPDANNRGLFTGSHKHPYLTPLADNVLCWRLGKALRKAAEMPSGDFIDTGLSLIHCLAEQGFSIVVAEVDVRKPHG